MYKNQLQELAQRSCFNLPSYACIREGPDHAPRFKATVNFNGEVFESPAFFSTLRQAEHAAAEVALSTVAKRGPSKRLAAQVLDERGVYKNLLQETAHRAGLNLPVYTAVRSGPGHVPVFSCTVELAGMTFTGQPAKSKKHAEKNAAMAAWSSLKQMSQSGSSSSSSNTSSVCHEEQDKVVVARYLCSLNPAESSNSPQNRGGGHEHNNRSFPSTTTTSFPLCYPNSNISPEMAIHYMWMQQQQQQQQQRRLMSLPIGVPPPNHLFPWMLHPTHHRLPYSFTDQQLLNRNVVTIQEIKEEEKTDNSPLRPTQKSFRIPVNGPRTPGGVRGLRVPFVAQPVQIRSVVPVFSAAPRRETMNRSQESPTSDEMRSETPGEISVMSSKMGNLHI